LILLIAGPEEGREPSGENVLRLIQDPFLMIWVHAPTGQ